MRLGHAAITCSTALAAALLCVSPAAAQLARNSSAPVDLTADQLEVVNAQCLAIWRGSAEALQADSRLRADVLKIYNTVGAARSASSGPNCGQVQRMEAEGSVYYVTPQQRVRGDAATYDAATETIVMTGDVVAAQGKNVLRGQRMVIHVNTGEAQMQTSVKGRNKPGRVRGVFYPNEQARR
ncbi:MAG: LptA/OstA family protein [Phenylobacterium sp.]|uniref:LptA/OstA family protein n=1 Tax=Phenylobacterium sp. TaxID=1871053 RepID=UPI002733C86F|nr:LptA/OstA family protein [Phenylobacterium sp.]MDP3173388.1 LptA/OstA family protein [Phenylobacterium sp.]